MKRYLLALPFLAGVTHAWADSQAVALTNYEASLTTGDTYVSGNRADNMFDVNGSANFPVATYLGAALSGDYQHTNVITNPFPDTTPASSWPSCSVRSENLDGGLFARNPSFGRIGVGYGSGRQKSRCSATFLATGTDSLNTRYTTASAEYYFSRVTLGAARTKVNIESDGHLDSDTLTARWYPVNDARVALAADGLDLKKTYHLNMEYQPAFLDNSLSLMFGYTTQRQTQSIHVITVGFGYFFGTDVDLLTRDRHYR